jgi:4-diphosphocytidyl-2-C-methyl-D-erythritol kinase
MVRFPNCKINLGLHATAKRQDGFHDIETVFYPIKLRDALEIITAPQLEIEVSGLEVEGNNEDNLCWKAYQLLKKDFPELPPAKIHLHKAIPTGAGLGGGSSDGAFMLRMINDKFHLELSQTALINYALQLGSDCPFFIINKPCFATGRGENLEPVDLDLSTYKIIIINPRVYLSTKDAFLKLTPQPPVKSIKEIVSQPISTWRKELKNDFEKPIFHLYPAIKDIKETMFEKGAVYAAMTGTGSTVYGIFPHETNPGFSFPENYISVILP